VFSWVTWRRAYDAVFHPALGVATAAGDEHEVHGLLLLFARFRVLVGELLLGPQRGENGELDEPALHRAVVLVRHLEGNMAVHGCDQ
jgi:hypothetical protein